MGSPNYSGEVRPGQAITAESVNTRTKPLFKALDPNFGDGLRSENIHEDGLAETAFTFGVVTTDDDETKTIVPTTTFSTNFELNNELPIADEAAIVSTGEATFDFTFGPHYLKIKINGADAVNIECDPASLPSPPASIAAVTTADVVLALTVSIDAQSLGVVATSATYTTITTDAEGGGIASLEVLTSNDYPNTGLESIIGFALGKTEANIATSFPIVSEGSFFKIDETTMIDDFLGDDLDGHILFVYENGNTASVDNDADTGGEGPIFVKKNNDVMFANEFVPSFVGAEQNTATVSDKFIWKEVAAAVATA